MRELLAGLSCPLCGGTRGDTLLVVIDSPGDGVGSVRAQCVRCHLFWSFALDPETGFTAPVAERIAIDPDPISIDEMIEVHRALGSWNGPVAELFRAA